MSRREFLLCASCPNERHQTFNSFRIASFPMSMKRPLGDFRDARLLDGNFETVEGNHRTWPATLISCFWAIAVACSGCVIHRSDSASGTETLWGFGYMKMRVSPVHEGSRVRASQVKTLGVN